MGNKITPSHIFLSQELKLILLKSDLKDRLVEIQEKEITEYAKVHTKDAVDSMKSGLKLYKNK